MTQGFGDFLLLLGGGCGKGAGRRANVGPGFRFFQIFSVYKSL